jgi:hypothetical protein
MSSTGYQHTRQQTDTIITALRDAATLVGLPAQRPVTLQTGGSITPGLGMESEAAVLRRRARDLQEGIFKVIVYGEFKHGKSTLLNAMLGSKLLPAKTLKCTAIISLLVYGEREEVAVYDSESEQPQIMGRDQFMQTFQLKAEDEETLNEQGYIDRFKNVEYAQVECLSPLCANGVCLVDSPGLGDHPSRTRVTTRYLRQSHAVVLVLNAMRLLGDDEKLFIRTELSPERVNNVFFVVNRINQINPHEVDEVQSYFRAFLAPYFTSADGSFDEALYQQRVFFVDALAALEERLSAAPDPARLETSGVPALEGSLERFLTSDQKNRTALDEAARTLGSIADEALATIEQQKRLQSVPLDQFEQTIDEVERHLQQLVYRKEDIERTIQRFGDMIAGKIAASLRDYLHTLRDNWEHDAHELRLDEVSIGVVMSSLVQGVIDRESAQRRIGEPIKREVERYMRSKMRAWAEVNVPQYVQSDLDTMVREVESQVVEFKLELERTIELISPEFAPDPDADRERFTEWTEALITGTLREVVGGEGAASPDFGNWGGIVWRIIQQALLLYVAVSLAGPIGWAVFAVAQVAQLFWAERQFKQKLLAKIGEELHRRLQHEVPAIQAEIRRDVSHQFNRLGHMLTTVLQDQIDDKRQELARVHEQKRDASFSAEQEQRRLDAIGERLVALQRLAAEQQ